MRIPLWLKISYTLMAVIIVPVYWRDLGPANLLWFSDIALIVLVPALWLENRFLASTMAVGVLLLELAWVLDLLTGGNLIQIAAYLFEEDTETHIRVLSALFHFALPPVLIFMLIRLGYDRRAFPAQVVLSLIVLPITYLVTDPSENNINWVFGPAEPQNLLHPWLYLTLLMATLTLFVYYPSHLVFKRFFPVREQ